MDEFEIERTSLNDDAPPTPHERQSLFVSRLDGRARILLALRIVAVCMLGLLLLEDLSPGLRTATASLLHPVAPASAEVAATGAETIYLEHGVPWGTVQLDGRVVGDPIAHPEDPLVVLPGAHTLIYQAPPFAPLRCHFSVPRRNGDTCPLEFAPPVDDQSLYVRIIDLHGTPDQLPANQVTMLAKATQQALITMDSATVVPAGSLLLGSSGMTWRTPVALNAQLTFRLNADTQVVAPYLPGSRLCTQLCYLGDSVIAPNGWDLLALTQVRWTYTRSDGAVVVAGAPANTLIDGSTTLVTVEVRWNGGWQVTALPHLNQFGVSPLCDVAVSELPPLLGSDGMAVPMTLTQTAAPVTAEGLSLSVAH